MWVEVDAAIFAGDLAHIDERPRIDPRAGRSAERTGYSERALLHGRAYQILHLPQLFGSDRPRAFAVDIGPYLAGSDVRSDIGRDALFQQAREVGIEVCEVRMRRGSRAAFTQDHGRHALTHHALGVAIRQQSVIRVVVYVDKTRGDNQSLGVDDPFGRSFRKETQSSDPASLDGDIAGEGRVSGAVGDAAVADEDIVVLRDGKRTEECDRQQELHL